MDEHGSSLAIFVKKDCTRGRCALVNGQHIGGRHAVPPTPAKH